MAFRAVCDCGWKGEPTRDGERASADRFRHIIWHMVDDSTRAQGVPFHVRDPETLRKVAVLLGYRP